MSIVKLLDLIDPQCIKLELESRKKKELTEEMVDLLFQSGKIEKKEKVEEIMMEREKKGSSGIGEGIAIPHVMSSEVPKTLMAFGLSKKGIHLGSIDGKPIYLVFFLIGPINDAIFHLKILAKLCRFLHNSLFKEALLNADSKEEIIQAFAEEEEREG